MATILVVETNSAGNGTKALRLAQARGLRTHFLSRSPKEYERHAVNPFEIADEVSVVETFDVTTLLRAVEGRTDYAAVLAYDELRVVQAALLGQYLGVPHNPPVPAVVRVRFKDQFRRALTGTRWEVRHAVIPLTVSSSPLSYPCVVKPIDEAASVGVTVCNNEQDFRYAMDRLRAVAGRVNARGYRLLPFGLVEEFLPGEEFSGEMVWSKRSRAWRLVGFTTKELHEGSSPTEVAHVFPHTFESDVTGRIVEELNGCLNALGLCDTLVHVEFRVCDGRVFVVEVNPRPAGNRISDLVEQVTGISLVELHLAAHLGAADDLLDNVRPQGCAGIRFLLPERSGTVRLFDIDPANDDGVIDLRTRQTPVNVGAALSNEAYLAHVLVRGSNAEEVTRLLNRHISRVHPRYDHELVSSPAGE